MKKSYIYVALIAVVSIGYVSCGGPRARLLSAFERSSLDIPRHLDSDSSEVQKAWWNNWPRPTHNFKVEGAINTNASVMTVGPAAFDEGRGTYAREIDRIDQAVEIKALADSKILATAWIEGMGDSRSIISAFNRKPDGTFTIDSRFNAAEEISNNWTWDFNGPGINPKANFIAWNGLHSFVSDEPWLGAFARSNYDPQFPLPKYPDGRDARGYTGSSTDPRTAKLYDALGSKDILGNVVWTANPTGARYDGKLAVNVEGTVKPVGDFSFGKDMGSDWWLNYTRDTVRYFIKNNVAGFWIDNATGFDSYGPDPVRRGFGDWTVYAFTQFANKYPAIRDAMAGRDLRKYLLDRFVQLNGRTTTGLLDNGWQHPEWLLDPVWKAFISYSSQTLGDRARATYKIIKEEAVKLGKNPQDIVVGGNDMPVLTFASMDGTELDIVNSEYNPGWHLDIGFGGRGVPPVGHSGPYYSLATRMARSRHATIWFYLDHDHEKYRHKTGIGRLLGYEALSHNVVLNGGQDNPRIAGTNDSHREVNTAIKGLAPLFDYRKQTGSVGLMFSYETQNSFQGPGGIVDQTSAQTFYGWGGALEDLKIPYQAFPDFRLSTETLADISVLILSNVVSIDPIQIEATLKPYLRAGGTLIITGENSGALKTKKDFYAANPVNILTQLAFEPEFAGKILFTPLNPGVDYFNARSRDLAAQDVAREQMRTLLSEFESKGVMVRQAQRLFGSDSTRFTLHDDNRNGRRFVDILNTDFDLSQDRWTGPATVAIRIHAPTRRFGPKPSVRFVTAENTTPRALAYTRPSSDFIDLTTEPFGTFASVVIDPTSDEPTAEEQAVLDAMVRRGLELVQTDQLTFEQWNVTYKDVTGRQGPTIEEAFDLSKRTFTMSVRSWFNLVRGKIIIQNGDPTPGQGPGPSPTSTPGPGANPTLDAIKTLAGTNLLTFHGWNHYYGVIMKKPGPAPNDVDFDEARQGDMITIDEWAGYLIRKGGWL